MTGTHQSQGIGLDDRDIHYCDRKSSFRCKWNKLNESLTRRNRLGCNFFSVSQSRISLHPIPSLVGPLVPQLNTFFCFGSLRNCCIFLWHNQEYPCQTVHKKYLRQNSVCARISSRIFMLQVTALSFILFSSEKLKCRELLIFVFK